MAIMENTVMESKMRRHRVRLVLGITGILLLIAIVAAAAYQDKRQEKKPAKREKVGQEALESTMGREDWICWRASGARTWMEATLPGR